jgi:signal peptidase II
LKIENWDLKIVIRKIMDDNHTENKQKINFKNERKHLGAFVFLLAVIISIGLDQITKHLAFTSSFGDFLNGLGPFFGKQLFLNQNFAFSLPLPLWLMYVCYALVLGAIILFLKKHWKEQGDLQLVAWGIITGSALSNIIERIINGHVRDFVRINTGIFNVADFLIIIGIFILLFYYPDSDNLLTRMTRLIKIDKNKLQ